MSVFRPKSHGGDRPSAPGCSRTRRSSVRVSQPVGPCPPGRAPPPQAVQKTPPLALLAKAQASPRPGGRRRAAPGAARPLSAAPGRVWRTPACFGVDLRGEGGGVPPSAAGRARVPRRASRSLPRRLSNARARGLICRSSSSASRPSLHPPAPPLQPRFRTRQADSVRAAHGPGRCGRRAPRDPAPQAFSRPVGGGHRRRATAPHRNPRQRGRRLHRDSRRPAHRKRPEARPARWWSQVTLASDHEQTATAAVAMGLSPGHSDSGRRHRAAAAAVPPGNRDGDCRQLDGDVGGRRLASRR